MFRAAALADLDRLFENGRDVDLLVLLPATLAGLGLKFLSHQTTSATNVSIS